MTHPKRSNINITYILYFQISWPGTENIHAKDLRQKSDEAPSLLEVSILLERLPDEGHPGLVRLGHGRPPVTAADVLRPKARNPHVEVALCKE